MEDVKSLIAGRDAPAAKAATFDRLNPSGALDRPLRSGALTR
jgi:hypothetical protein